MDFGTFSNVANTDVIYETLANKKHSMSCQKDTEEDADTANIRTVQATCEEKGHNSLFLTREKRLLAKFRKKKVVNLRRLLKVKIDLFLRSWTSSW